MGKMSELAYDIEQLYIDGHNAKTISRILGCPQEIVDQWLTENGLGNFSLKDELSPYVTVNS